MSLKEPVCAPLSAPIGDIGALYENMIASRKSHAHSLGATSAPAFLEEAAKIMQERGKQYDSPGGERSMQKCIHAFNAITGKSLTTSEGWLIMLLLKQVRQFMHPGFHKDSADDAIAYAALLAEAKQEEAI